MLRQQRRQPGLEHRRLSRQGRQLGPAGRQQGHRVAPGWGGQQALHTRAIQAPPQRRQQQRIGRQQAGLQPLQPGFRLLQAAAQGLEIAPGDNRRIQA